MARRLSSPRSWPSYRAPGHLSARIRWSRSGAPGALSPRRPGPIPPVLHRPHHQLPDRRRDPPVPRPRRRAPHRNRLPGRTSYLHADLNDPAALLQDARNLLDFGHLGAPARDGDQAARTLLAQIAAGLPPGSYLALADRTSSDPLHNLAARAYNHSGAAPTTCAAPPSSPSSWSAWHPSRPRHRPHPHLAAGPQPLPAHPRPSLGRIARTSHSLMQGQPGSHGRAGR